MRFNDAITGAFFLALALGIIVVSTGFHTPPGQRFGPGLFPVCTALLMAAAGCALIRKGLRNLYAHPWVKLADWWRKPRLVLNGAAILGALLAYLLLVETVGFLILVPLVLWGLIGLLWGRPMMALPIAVLAALVIHLFFVELLKVPLPWGWVPYFKVL